MKKTPDRTFSRIYIPIYIVFAMIDFRYTFGTQVAL